MAEMTPGQLNPEDRLLTCADCGTEFIFTAGESVYFESKRLSIPKRCPDCRRQRKATIVPDRRWQL